MVFGHCYTGQVVSTVRYVRITRTKTSQKSEVRRGLNALIQTEWNERKKTKEESGFRGLIGKANPNPAPAFEQELTYPSFVLLPKEIFLLYA